MIDALQLFVFAVCIFGLGYIAGNMRGWTEGYNIGTKHGDELYEVAKKLSDSAKLLKDEALHILKTHHPDEWDV